MHSTTVAFQDRRQVGIRGTQQIEDHIVTLATAKLRQPQIERDSHHDDRSNQRGGFLSRADRHPFDRGFEAGDDLAAAGLRVELDDRAESLNKKVRESQLRQIPLILTIGAKEQAADTLAVRTLDGKVRYGVSREAFLETVLAHIRNRELDLTIFGD